MIKVNNVTKAFTIPGEKRDTVKSVFLRPFSRKKKESFNALTDISFEVKKGEFVGVIGRNGSGKSTILKLIAGVYAPTSGTIEVNGNIVPFLELGVGVNPELTGRENIYLNGAILGMTRKYMEEKFDEIVEFAELEEFIDMQVKNYSSGMMMRLAFSVATQVKADIYLLDEVLSVGDAGFQKKSLAKMRELLSGGSTVLYVSHTEASVKKYCDRVIYLQKGHKIFDGNTDKGLIHYQLSFIESEEERSKFLKSERAKDIESEFMKNKKRLDLENKGKTELEKILAYEDFKLSLLTETDGDLFEVQQRKVLQLKSAVENEEININKILSSAQAQHNDGADIREFKITDIKSKKIKKIKVGEDFLASVKFVIKDDITNPVAGVSLMANGNAVQVFNTPRKKNEIISSLSKGDKLEVTFEGKVAVNPGIYQIRVHLGDPAIHGKEVNEMPYLNTTQYEIEVYSEEIPDIRKWDRQKNPMNFSGYINHNFTYKEVVTHE